MEYINIFHNISKKMPRLASSKKSPAKTKRLPKKIATRVHKDIEKNTVIRLREIASKYNIRGRSKMKKAELIKAIMKKEEDFLIFKTKQA